MAWSPKNLGGALLYWWDSDDYTAMRFATEVSDWFDKNQKLRAANATGNQQPTLNIIRINNIPTGYLLFNSAGVQRLLSFAVATPEQWTAFTVFYLTNTSATRNIFTHADAGGTLNYSIYSRTTTTTASAQRWKSGGSTVVTSPNRTVAATTDYIFSSRFDGLNVSAALQGEALQDTAWTGTPNIGTHAIGIGTSAGAFGPMHGRVYCLLLFRIALPVPAIQKVEGWLARKYNIPLASGHPYLSVAP